VARALREFYDDLWRKCRKLKEGDEPEWGLLRELDSRYNVTVSDPDAMQGQ
jgi:hypothetical protein